MPSRRRIRVVSMCQISSGRAARMPIVGFSGWTRRRGRRHPRSRTSRCQVDSDAKTEPRRCARTASRPVGTWRKSGDVTISRTLETSAGVRRCGEEPGHDGTSASSHARAARRHAERREGESPRTERTRRSPRTSRVRSTARSSRVLSSSPTRSLERSGLSVRSRAKSTRRTAAWRLHRRSRRATRARRTAAVSSPVAAALTARGERRSHPAAVDLGTPSLVAMLVSPVS